MVEKHSRYIVKDGVKYKLVPPEGGWGYMICVSIAIQFLSVFAHVQCFGIVYNDFLVELDEGSSGVTLFTGVLTMSYAVSGFLSNAILRRLSLRQVSLLGSIIFTSGTFLGIFVRSMPHLIITNGVLQAIGAGLVIPVAYTSFNSYFTQKKLVYLSVVKFVIGIGSVAAPLALKYTMDEYGFRGTLALVFGFGLHSILASVILQPVECHLKMVEVNEDEEKALLKAEEDSRKLEDDIASDTATNDVSKDNKMLHESREPFLDRSFDLAKKFPKRLSIPSYLEVDRRIKTAAPGDELSISCFVEKDGKDELVYRTTVVNLAKPKENYEATVVTKHGLSYARLDSQDEEYLTNLVKANSIMSLGNLTHAPLEPLPPILDKKGRLKIVVDYFDLSLFKDIIYTNTCLGMAISMFTDVTFFMLLPLYLYTIDWDRTMVSHAVALQAIGDMVARMSLAIICKFVQVNSRYLFFAGIVVSVMLRIVFGILGEPMPMLVLITAMGFVRCGLHVTPPVVIAERVPIKLYPAAYGLFMFVFGVSNMIGGLTLGIIRDYTGSYTLVFNLLTGILVLCAVPWIIEFIICRAKKPNKSLETSGNHAVTEHTTIRTEK